MRATVSWDGDTTSAAYRLILPTRSPVALNIPSNVTDWLKRRHGLVLVTGPAGAGATTTLATLADHVNRTRAARIMRFGSPVEHTLERTKKGLVTERQVERSETTETLRNAAKEDADLVVDDEPPTIESVEAALMLAGGRLVAAGLKTTSVYHTVTRILWRFAPGLREWAQQELARVLAGITSQTLVGCREPRSSGGDGRVAAFEITTERRDHAAGAPRGTTRQARRHRRKEEPMRKTPYLRIILELDPTVDAVGVEANMRLHYGTLDHLSRDEFKTEIAIAKEYEAAVPGFLKRCAESYGWTEAPPS